MRDERAQVQRHRQRAKQLERETTGEKKQRAERDDPDTGPQQGSALARTYKLDETQDDEREGKCNQSEGEEIEQTRVPWGNDKSLLKVRTTKSSLQQLTNKFVTTINKVVVCSNEFIRYYCVLRRGTW